MTSWLRFPFLALGAALVAASGCRGEDISFDCENQAMALFDRAADEAPPLRDPVPDDPPYPVALQLSEEGVNRLLKSAIEDGEIPFTGDFNIVTAQLDFQPKEEVPPVLVLDDVFSCPNCVLFKIEFYLQVNNEGVPASASNGSVALAIPLVLEDDETAGQTRLIADYSKADIVDLEFEIFGFLSEDYDSLREALEILLTEKIQQDYEPYTLLTIGSWHLGNDEVRLLAKKLIVDVVNKKLVLAMQTNLPLPANAALDLSQPLPEDIPMTVSLHPDLFLSMSHRMLTEGEIPRRYDENGEPDDKGTYAVSLNWMRASATGADQLDTRFRVWRIAEGYCGWAEADMPLDLEINNDAMGFSVTPGDASLVVDENCEGSGCVAQEEEEIVEDNQDLIATFRESLAEQVGDTINFDSFSLENSLIVFSIVELVTSSDAIQSNVDFKIYAKP